MLYFLISNRKKISYYLTVYSSYSSFIFLISSMSKGISKILSKIPKKFHTLTQLMVVALGAPFAFLTAKLIRSFSYFASEKIEKLMLNQFKKKLSKKSETVFS